VACNNSQAQSQQRQQQQQHAPRLLTRSMATVAATSISMAIIK